MNFSNYIITLEEEGIRKRKQFFCWCSKDLLNGKKDINDASYLEMGEEVYDISLHQECRGNSDFMYFKYLKLLSINKNS